MCDDGALVVCELVKCCVVVLSHKQPRQRAQTPALAAVAKRIRRIHVGRIYFHAERLLSAIVLLQSGGHEVFVAFIYSLHRGKSPLSSGD